MYHCDVYYYHDQLKKSPNNTYVTDYDTHSSSILIKYKLWLKWFVDETYYGRTGVWTKRLESKTDTPKSISNIGNS